MQTKRGLVDLSSLIWTALQYGRDTDCGREHLNDKGKPVWVNGWMYGYETAMDNLTTWMKDLGLQPSDLILVKEGMNSKADRQCIHPDYKAGRDKVEAQYEQFTLARDAVIDAFTSVGANVVWQDGGVEADDVLGYLARNLDGEIWIISGDKDLAQCIGGRIHHLRAGVADQNPFGPFDPRLIPVYIALVGDAGDKIPGAPGFGAKAMEKLLTAFGEEGLVLMEGLITDKKLARLEEDVGDLKELQKILDNQASVYMSYELGRLRVEKVNTVRRPLSWQVGMVKPRKQIADERIKPYGGIVKLVHAGVYDQAKAWARDLIEQSPWVSLDVETSTPDESDEWFASRGKDDGVDVLGSKLTSLQLTFGANMQYSVYLPVDNVEEEGVPNLTVDQVREFVEMVPRDKHLIIHNAAFELPVCFNAWGEHWINDPLYHGFLPNVIDSRIMSSYVNENVSAGLKSLSKSLLGYDQVSYDTVTSKEMLASEWDGKGKVVKRFKQPVIVEVATPTGEVDGLTGAAVQSITEVATDGPDMVRVKYKMNQLRAREVLSYGADDTICTAAVANWFRIVMEMERTWTTFMQVEQFPAYLTAKGFLDGVDFSLEEMAAMEREDNEAYDKAWPVLRDYLIKVGFDGTVCPVYEEMTPAVIKEVFTLLAPGHELKTLVRKLDKLAKFIEQWADEYAGPPEDATELNERQIAAVQMLAVVVGSGDIKLLNDLVKRNFSGEPHLDLASPKQMTRLLYDFMKLPVNIINDCTPTEKINKPDLAKAVGKFKRKCSGKLVTMTEDEMKLVRLKAKADDTAVDWALAFDTDVIAEEAQAALRAIGTMKKVMTRRSLFYKTYWSILHWSTGKIHAQANQCAAVTRRYSMSDPNLQQLPKKGEAVRFRGCFKPHVKDAVICSIDFSGQELRLAAEVSQDKNMLACYVGDNLKDIHSITAASAMKLKWGAAFVASLFESNGADLQDTPEGQYDLFLRLRKVGKAAPIGKRADDLRKDSKGVNFTAQFGGQAATVSHTLIMPLADAQLFLDARSKMFPGVDKAAKLAEDDCRDKGYATTLMGARRHLRDQIMSDDNGTSARAARQAWSMKIQGSAAEMNKLAMARLWLSDFLWKYRTRFIAPIHDELVTSIHRDDVVDAVKIKHECMVAPYSTMKVPVLGSISIGADFANQIECGDWYAEQNLVDAVNEIFTPKASSEALAA